ncbi:Aste57867_8457 [Aphanomyces stellatus]|uniref:Aste57867_8457 protein n=1 Tax=Aphanomyces stellatus TaxID=120398 RepID=A0A485KKC1_9STRA|nr:hypothetical protein As57867_008425 [Aphanomyces stellatus]VFT85343.1 Aste57867_8457 [Aphanomyces stellatus]
MCFLYFATSPADLHIVQAYAPTHMGVVVSLFAALHLHGLFRTIRITETKSRRRWVDLDRHSHQAYHTSHYLIDSVNAIGFVVVVSLNCIVPPWFPLSKHNVVQQSVVPLLESFFGFFLSTLFQSYVQLDPALLYSFNAPHTHVFTTRLVLASRCLLVTLPLDLVNKIVIQFSSNASLRKLVKFNSVPHRRMVSTGPSNASLRVASHFHLEFHRHRAHMVYAVSACV